MVPSWNIKVEPITSFAKQLSFLRKISILELGAFKTNSHRNCPVLPALDVYQTPEASSFQLRSQWDEGKFITGDVLKAAEKIFQFTKLENPPLRWQIGKGAINAIRAQLESILEESKRLESWSEDLDLDGT